MNTIVKYTDLLGQDLNFQQTADRDDYIEYTIVDNQLKKERIQYYRKAKDELMVRIEYFLGDHENRQEVIKSIFADDIPNRLILYQKKDERFGYTEWKWHLYDLAGKVKGLGGIRVLDPHNRTIFFCNYSSANSYETATKWLYGNVQGNTKEEVLLTIKYDLLEDDVSIEDTNARFGYGNLETFDVDYMRLLAPGFWEKHPYYHNHFPILPESSLINRKHADRIKKEILSLCQSDLRTFENNIRNKISSVLLFKDYITRLKAWKKALQIEYIPLGRNINLDRNNVLTDIVPDLEHEMISYQEFSDYVFEILNIRISNGRYKNGLFIYLYIYWQIFKDSAKVELMMIENPELKHPYDGIIKIFRHDYIFQHDGLNIMGLTMGNSGVSLPSIDDLFLDFLDKKCQYIGGFIIPEQSEIDKLWQEFQNLQG